MRLPYFPLHVVVFPHLPLPIHVFEERYRLMTQDVVADGSPFAGRFVVSMITEGAEVADADPRPPRAERVGTIVEVRQRRAIRRWAVGAAGGRRRAGPAERGRPHPARTPPSRPSRCLTRRATPTRAEALLPEVQAALDAYLETVKRFVASAASIGAESPEITTVAASLDEVLKPIRLPDDPMAASYAVGGVLQIELTPQAATAGAAGCGQPPQRRAGPAASRGAAPLRWRHAAGGLRGPPLQPKLSPSAP